MRIIFVFAALIIFVVILLVLHKKKILNLHGSASSSAISSTFLTLQGMLQSDAQKAKEYILEQKEEKQKSQAKTGETKDDDRRNFDQVEELWEKEKHLGKSS